MFAGFNPYAGLMGQGQGITMPGMAPRPQMAGMPAPMPPAPMQQHAPSPAALAAQAALAGAPPPQGGPGDQFGGMQGMAGKLMGGNPMSSLFAALQPKPPMPPAMNVAMPDASMTGLNGQKIPMNMSPFSVAMPNMPTTAGGGGLSGLFSHLFGGGA